MLRSRQSSSWGCRARARARSASCSPNVLECPSSTATAFIRSRTNSGWPPGMRCPTRNDCRATTSPAGCAQRRRAKREARSRAARGVATPLPRLGSPAPRIPPRTRTRSRSAARPRGERPAPREPAAQGRPSEAQQFHAPMIGAQTDKAADVGPSVSGSAIGTVGTRRNTTGSANSGR